MTLFEISIVTVIAGILAGIATPSMMGMLQGNRVKQAVDQVYSALQDAQGQAIRRGQKCTIKFDNSVTPPTIDSVPQDAGCLASTNKQLPTGVVMKHNLTPSTVSFSYKGNTTLADSGTIVIQTEKGKGEKQCLVISDGLGIMRRGVYKGDTTSSVTADNCTTNS
ncbi:pilus assembly FimT family protein [Aphanothece sacrum]|uniref:Type IV pilin n=1 Tax=Aphanothece sacrum FPU1 TaxID=1920663 RepID=A0A401ICD6_APHSA|nr:GspH/FimT family pseudopilin [Aphanothece sacrum]GBF78948.1 type IV pilin [Aphanothece sacrum FPU1]GBF86704.1 type IV pilin [Aphanothece sacrum FPU3]